MNHYTENTQIVPQNGFVGIVIAVLFIYFFVRHFVFSLMVIDIVIGWLREFDWFPGPGRREKAMIHWVIAGSLLGGFLFVAAFAGWVEVVRK